jgi:hypothetical protein
MEKSKDQLRRDKLRIKEIKRIEKILKIATPDRNCQERNRHQGVWKAVYLKAVGGSLLNKEGEMKKGDVCIIVADIGPQFHHLTIGSVVLIREIYRFNSYPYWSRYAEEGRNRIYEDFKKEELLKIGKL